MLVEVRVAGLAVDPQTNMPIILLQEPDKQDILPIWIGIFEASAIATQMEKIQIARPMTHDLLRNIMDQLGGVLLRIEITEVKENTFFSHLVVRKASNEDIQIDSRPSDAIALALRCNAPILVESSLIERTAQAAQQMQLKNQSKTAEEWEELLKNMSDDSFGKYKM